MGKFSLSRLIMCTKYDRLNSEDYIRLGLCQPDSCPDCFAGRGHYVKNDKVEDGLILNNQLRDDKLSPQSPFNPIVNKLNPIVNDLGDPDISCNKCKEQTIKNSHANCTKNSPTTNKVKVQTLNNVNVKNAPKGFVNLAFVDSLTEGAPWYQPRMARDLAVRIVSECPVGSFIIRRSQTHTAAAPAAAGGCLALTVRVPRSFNGTGILHYLILVTEAGFRIKGLTKVFPSLSALVVHHSVMKESLPCRLIVEDESSSASSGSEDECSRESDFADLDSEPEYPCIISRLRQQLSSK